MSFPGDSKRKASPAPEADAAPVVVTADAVAPNACSICLEALNGGLFVGACGHTFHVACAERVFVVGRQRNCPLCRAEFENAPGHVAMAAAEANMAMSSTVGRMVAPSRAPARQEMQVASVLPDLPVSTPAVVTQQLAEDFAKATVVMDVKTLAPGQPTKVTSLVTIRCKV